jgi:hypothetical protein
MKKIIFDVYFLFFLFEYLIFNFIYLNYHFILTRVFGVN